MARVLVACEFSGTVREAFARRGHYAMSCDFLMSDIPGPHYRGDVRDVLWDSWDLMVAFPPCTDLCLAGNRWMDAKIADGWQERALRFVRELMSVAIPRYCIENPVGVISRYIRKPDQIIQPWQFGHGECKKTCLWLKNLPPLRYTRLVAGRHEFVPLMHGSGAERAMNRSRTFPGIAEAMVDQWSAVLQ